MSRYAVIRDSKVANIAIASAPFPLQGETWIDVTSVVPAPGIGWTWQGGTNFTAPADVVVPAAVYRVMTAEAFWDRWTQSDRLNFDVASQHNPADTNAQKREAAKLRLFKQDIGDAGRVNPSKNKIRNFVIALEGTVLTAGQAAIILDTPITQAEAS